jgi:hypothetical protein
MWSVALGQAWVGARGIALESPGVGVRCSADRAPISVADLQRSITVVRRWALALVSVLVSALMLAMPREAALLMLA